MGTGSWIRWRSPVQVVGRVPGDHSMQRRQLVSQVIITCRGGRTSFNWSPPVMNSQRALRGLPKWDDSLALVRRPGDADKTFPGFQNIHLPRRVLPQNTSQRKGMQAHFHAHDFTPTALSSTSHNSLQRVNQKYKQKGANEQSVLADTTNRMKASALIN